MKRVLHYLPYAGLALLVLALLVRGLRREGLGLASFPAPAETVLAGVDYAPPAASIVGRVVDAEGEPVSEAFVVTRLGSELGWTFSEVNGAFDLVHLPPGATTVQVVARHFRARSFTLDAPGEDVVLVLDERLAELEELPELSREDLEGELRTPATRRGLLGYEVVLLPEGPLHEAGSTIPARAEVSADRGFRFPELLHGAYRVVVLPPWARGGSWPNLCDEAHRVLEHRPSGGALELPLAAGELGGRVLDAAGDPVHGAIVRVTPAGEPRRPWPPVATGSDGGFEVSDLPPGTYAVEVQAGEGRWTAEAEVQAGYTSVLDVPPLALR